MVRRSASALSVAFSEFEASIAERAYFKAEQRGFVPGHELEDWLAAERELSPPVASVAGTSAKPKKSLARRRNGSSKKLK